MAKCVRFNMTLKPFVYWAQTEADIFLKIDVKKIEGEPDVCIEEEEIEFTAKGIGSQVSYQHKSYSSKVFNVPKYFLGRWFGGKVSFRFGIFFTC